MTSSQRSNIICAVICFLFAVFYLYFTVNLHPGALSAEFGTKFVPKLLAMLMAILSVLLVIVTLAIRPAQKESEPEEPEMADEPAFYGTVLASFLSLAVWSLVGFLSVPFLIGGTMVANGSRDTVKIIAVSLGTTLILYLMFYQLFELPVPLGLLEALLE